MVGPAELRRRMNAIHRRLVGMYGERRWDCWGDGVSVLVGTILSQNTSNANSSAAYRRLRRTFGSWPKVMRADMNEVERAIRVSGLSRQKAPRIQAILSAIKEETGRVDLQFLKDMKPEAAYQWLIRFKGIGPKTAHCTLLFAFRMALFPVDTHIERIARRLRLVSPKADAAEVNRLLEPAIAPQQRYAMHVLLIEHGRKTCRAISPRCDECALLGLCPEGKQRLSSGRRTLSLRPGRR